jgi:hypothetical protein
MPVDEGIKSPWDILSDNKKLKLKSWFDRIQNEKKLDNVGIRSVGQSYLQKIAVCMWSMQERMGYQRSTWC